MKISSLLNINYPIYNKSIKYFSNEHLYFRNQLKSDTISFSAKEPTLIEDLREIENLPCACCGNPMLKNSVVNKFTTKDLYPSAYETLILLQEQNMDMQKATKEDREVYDYLLGFAAKHKENTINELFTHNQIKSYRKRLSHKEKEAFINIKERIKNIAFNSAQMVRKIEELHPVFQDTEQQAFNELKELSKLYPNETFHTILNKPEIKKIYLKNLQNKQIKIIKNINKLKENLPRRYQFELKEPIQKCIDIIKNEDETSVHIKQQIVDIIKLALNRIRTTKQAQEIFDELDKFPDSKNDVDALMIKGSQKTSNVLALILVTRPRNTREHALPQYRGGQDDENNYIYLCGKCNEERQNEIYTTFVKRKPQMPANTQKQINMIIQLINAGVIIKHDDYPKSIKQVLNKESGGSKNHKGKINIDISKLDINKARMNRDSYLSTPTPHYEKIKPKKISKN